MSELLAGTSILIGAFFMLVSSIGLVRLPDVYCRMHAATKATTFGMGGILMATAIAFESAAVATQAFLAIYFLVLTAPVAAHLISRAAYRKGPNISSATSMDDYRDYLGKKNYLEKKRSTSQTEPGA